VFLLMLEVLLRLFPPEAMTRLFLPELLLRLFLQWFLQFLLFLQFRQIQGHLAAVSAGKRFGDAGTAILHGSPCRRLLDQTIARRSLFHI
jgi:hypothetical protein